MKKPAPQQLTVIHSEKISPNMRRITLHDNELAKLPTDCEGSYIKLLFNGSGGTDLSSLQEGERPVMRTYTIRQFDPKLRTIEVDFVCHVTQDLQCGFAARWAMNATVGSTITVAGPGMIQDLNTDVDWFFMVADMTALPALSAKIKKLPSDAKGYAVIKIIEKGDIQPLKAPKNFQVVWLTGEESLESHVKALPWLSGQASVWTACEFDSMRALRQYFRNEKEVSKENIYISSYWKKGVSEDGHKVIKQQDAAEHVS
ncbi:siderophore-interacting protein [uncultured Vibrio sp.]|uniref:siderophore-interacting protein n=1 Tax=uncultured Vibrio sp. TaxID=114054 RepID=UPI000913501D|nr:siderophore-interacting protein [uncultured Vibrio sp.]OIQ26401.1 MAG: NADPH-dependent ferric siderophore reductase [Vibrio sp. MedPE-SWchi]